MKICYKKNCSIYYDEEKSATIIIKRNNRFMIKNNKEEYYIIKNIIYLTNDGINFEDLLKKIPMEEKETYLQYLKLLMKQNIICECLTNKVSLNEDFYEYIFSTYDNCNDIFKFFENEIIGVYRNNFIKEELEKFGLKVVNFNNQIEYDSVKVVIGNIDNSTCKKIIERDKKVILCYEKEKSIYMLYINKYDENQINMFREFSLNSNIHANVKEIVIPINLIVLFIKNYFEKETVNMCCITDDAAVYSFEISNLNDESLKYYNRERIKKIGDNLELLMRIESMVHNNPFIVKKINKTNAESDQTIVFSYEICFGEFLYNERYVCFGEDYVESGINAFINGIEKILNNNSSSYNWVCARTLEEYYIKGYISLIKKEKFSYKRVSNFSKKNTEIIRYIQEILNIDINITYSDVFNNKIGIITISDKNDYILYRSGITYNFEKSITEGLYEIIGNYFNIEKNKKITNIEGKIILHNSETNILLQELKEYFTDNYLIVDEEPWVYQGQLESVGVHVGHFMLV